MNEEYVTYLGKVLEQCRFLSDMYMIDYFIEDLWNKLPKSWKKWCQQELNTINDDKTKIIGLVNYILRSKPKNKYSPQEPEPLSLLSLRNLIENVCLKQGNPIQKPSEVLDFLNMKNKPQEISEFTILKKVLPPALRLKIKNKKEHELSRIVDVVKILLDNIDVEIDEIVDIGAGIGHLSRILSLLIPDKVVSTIEGDACLVEKASKIDEKITKSSKNKWESLKRKTIFVKEEGQLDEISGKSLFLTGLHTCGDFASTIIKHFVKNDRAKILLNFGCCYHKLNGGLDKVYRDIYINEDEYLQTTEGYPMSKGFEKIPVTYAAREVACFGHEQFIAKLNESIDKKVFFVNCYRAILEWIILDCPIPGENETIDDNYRHKGLRGFRGAESMDFWQYASEALRDKPEIKQRFDVNVQSKPWLAKKIEQMVKDEAEKTLLLYTFRLFVAPVIEAVILRDRQAYLMENNVNNSYLIPLFDPFLSPRNVALVAWK